VGRVLENFSEDDPKNWESVKTEFLQAYGPEDIPWVAYIKVSPDTWRKFIRTIGTFCCFMETLQAAMGKLP